MGFIWHCWCPIPQLSASLSAIVCCNITSHSKPV